MILPAILVVILVVVPAVIALALTGRRKRPMG